MRISSRGYERNILLSYLLEFVGFFGITTFWVLYLKQRGMSLVEIGLLESVFHLTSFISEVPSGMLADRFSYKSNLIISQLMKVISALFMIFSSGFWGFALGMIFNAWAYNFDSGTSTAMLFESVEGAGKKEKFLTYNGIFSAVIEITMALGQVAAGLLVHSRGGLIWSYWIAIILALLAIAVIFLMKEPDDSLKEKTERMTFVKIIKTVRQEFKREPYILEWIIWIYGTACFAMMFNFYYQSEMDSLKGWQISVIMVIATVINVAGAWLATKLGPKYNSLKLWPIFIGATALLYMLSMTENSLVYVLVYLLPNAIYAMTQTVFDNDFQQRISSSIRATMSSIASMMWSISMIVVFPLTGVLIEAVGFSHSFVFLGIAMVVSTIIMMLRFRVIKEKMAD
jgi:MFS family permease